MEIAEEFIKEQTTPDYFDRGWEYYRQGRVIEYRESEDLITAVVRGSEDYTTEIDLASLNYHCTCPAYEHDRLCKHLVATLLTKIHGTISKPQKKSIKKSAPVITNKNLSDKSKVDLCFDELKKEIDKMLGRLDRYWGNYWAYVDQQERIFEFVSIRMNELLDSPKNSDELLKIASWLDEELTHYDDSDGILQDTISEIVSKSVRFLENSRSISNLDIFYEYTSQNHEFDLGLTIIESIFEEVKNPLIAGALGKEIERAMTEESDKFAFDPKYALVFWSEYLRNHDPIKFEALAYRYYQQEITIAKQLIQFYLETGKLKDAILVGWPQRHHYMINSFLIPALEKFGEVDKLILYYQESCCDHLNMESLRKLKEIYTQNNRHAEWDEFSNTLLKRKLTDWERVDLLMMLKRYVEAALILSEVEFWPGRATVVDYAKKLSILDKQAGVIIYRALLDKEARKMASSNYYPVLMSYLDKLRELGDILYVKQFIQDMQEKYPTKKKLQQLLISVLLPQKVKNVYN